jgi:phage N-6-adenine-methyltransferase
MKCRRCKAIITPAAMGRPRRFCSTRCRVASWRRRRPVYFTSESCEWSTPPDLFVRLDARFGFTLDVCATHANAKCSRFYTKADNGLDQPWTGRVWCNPPYGKGVGLWVKKAWESVQSGEAEVVVVLIFARTDTWWWHDWAVRGEIEFLRGRLRFGGVANSAPFPSALVVFRNKETVTKPVVD